MAQLYKEKELLQFLLNPTSNSKIQIFKDSNIFGMLTYFFLVVGHVTRVYLMRR